MPVAPVAGHGEIAEQIGGATRLLRLGNGEIERLEKLPSIDPLGIYEIAAGFRRERPMPNSRQVRDIIAMALVGGGLPDLEADRLVAEMEPGDLPRAYIIAQAALFIALYPDFQKKSGGADGRKRKPRRTSKSKTS